MEWETKPFSTSFIEKVRKYVTRPESLIVSESSTADRLLEIAGILATAEYHRLKSAAGDYVTTQIANDTDAFLQILKITWNCVPIENYAAYKVGPPALVIRKPGPSDAHYVYVSKDMNLSFIPKAKFCRGRQDPQRILPCVFAHSKNPFGRFLGGSSSEQCSSCRGSFECTRCLSMKPLCDGYSARCGDVEFAGSICCGLFALYITRFGPDLKVGTAIYSNILGRLLEQGVGCALVFYPIEGIMNAYLLEKSVKGYLKDHLRELSEFGVRKVFTRSPPRPEILSDFMTAWDRNDKELLDRLDLMMQKHVLRDGDRIIKIANANVARPNLLPNYEPPPDYLLSKYVDARPAFDSISGKVEGYRGSFVFLDSGEVADFKELDGYVVRGKI
jgi:hypothetical protein